MRKLLDVVFIVVLGTVSVALLIAAQGYSAPAVRRYRETRLKTNVLAAAGIEADRQSLSETFDQRVRQLTRSGETWYAADSLVIYEFRGRGLWGLIEGIITVDSGFTHIVSVRILSQEETPGLGDRIKEPGYLATYRGKTVYEPLELALRHKATLENEVDAISGATLSSEALLTTVNKAIARLHSAMKGKAS